MTVSISPPKPAFGQRTFSALGILVLILLWQLGAAMGGAFVLPPPLEVAKRFIGLARAGTLWAPALVTTWQTLAGYVLGCLTGFMFGLAGGSAKGLGVVLNSMARLVLGVPPIIWVVLALFWFGPVGRVAIFTVAIGIAPIIFSGTLAGMQAAQPELDELASAFKATQWQHFWEIRLPQIMVTLLPALTTSLGLSWKMALMAEVLSGDSGIGGEIATMRAYLDTVGTMAWVMAALALLLGTDIFLQKLMSALPMNGR
ncbi:ABC transporter permease [Acidocella sp.]|uniref:ABC transporter permease n=1 Tax=Acidocella sp. TaxID=50710 RepID=UPI003CFD4282